MKKTTNPWSNTECFGCDHCPQIFGYDKDCLKHEKEYHNK